MSRVGRPAVWLLSIVSILVLWAILAAFFPPTLLPGPVTVARRLGELAIRGDFWLHLEMSGQATLKENPHNFHGALHGRCQKCSALLGAGALRVPDGAMIRALFHVFGNKHAA